VTTATKDADSTDIPT